MLVNFGIHHPVTHAPRFAGSREERMRAALERFVASLDSKKAVTNGLLNLAGYTTPVIRRGNQILLHRVRSARADGDNITDYQIEFQLDDLGNGIKDNQVKVCVVPKADTTLTLDSENDRTMIEALVALAQYAAIAT